MYSYKVCLKQKPDLFEAHLFYKREQELYTNHRLHVNACSRDYISVGVVLLVASTLLMYIYFKRCSNVDNGVSIIAFIIYKF
jgi:hypothetical protein